MPVSISYLMKGVVMMSKHSYMCRTTRPTRIFSKPTDVHPTSNILDKKMMFLSNNMIENGTVMLFEISEAVDGTELPLGYWVASDVLEYYEIENEDVSSDIENSTTSDDSVVCNEEILVSGSDITIYDSKDSSTPITHGLKLGNVVKVTRKVHVFVNGRDETRYLISQADDPDVVGKWLLENYSVTVEGYEIKYHTHARVQPRVHVPGTTVSGVVTNTETPSVDTTNPDTSTITNTLDPEANMKAEANRKSMEEVYELYGMDYDTATESTMGVPIGRMVFVHGMPFQYNYITDRRNGTRARYGRYSSPDEKYSIRMKNGNTDQYGRTFSKEIACNMPIVTIVPGTPVFMTNISQGLLGYRGNDQVKNNWQPFWSSLTNDEFDSALENMMNSGAGETYQYYTMQVDTTDYFNYVNALCGTSARLMGLSNFTYHGKKCHQIDWQKYNSSADQDYSAFEEVVGVAGGVSFAFDPLSSITDTLSNSVTDSQFSDMIRGLSAKAREAEFMTGTAGIAVEAVDSINYEGATAGATNNGGVFAGLNNAVHRLGTLVKNTAHGMNVRFPQLWSDSSYSKSYSIEMRFITPYNTAFCKWRYVLVPFFTVFCLAAPQSPTSVVNYKRPFLIRAFSKGYFNVEMGMIESITWKRFGDGDMISEDGVPTQIDVTIDFQDLYQQLAISKFQTEGGNMGSAEAIGVFFNNTGLMDMLGQLSGVNMNRINLGERLSLYAGTAVGAFSPTGVGSNFMQHISDRVRNVFEPFIYGM